MRISCTAVRVPTMRAHAMTVVLEFEEGGGNPPVTAENARSLLTEKADEFVFDVVDNLAENEYPMPVFAANKDKVQVQRLSLLDHHFHINYRFWHATV